MNENQVFNPADMGTWCFLSAIVSFLKKEVVCRLVEHFCLGAIAYQR